MEGKCSAWKGNVKHGREMLSMEGKSQAWKGNVKRGREM